MTIGDRIKNKRAALELTLDDLAKVVKVSRQTIQKYESGVISNIPSDKIESLAFVLRTTPSFLMGWDEHEEPQTIAAHFDGEEYTEDEMDEIKQFAAFVKSRQK